MNLRLVLVTCAYISLASGHGHPGYTELGHSISSLSDEDIAEIVMREFFENQNKYIHLYAPDAKADDCNASMLKKNSTSAHNACKAECFAISDTILDGHLKNPTHELIQTLHRECTGFDGGVCKIKRVRLWTDAYCECQGVGFTKSSSYCRRLIFGFRVTNNVVVFIKDGIKKYNEWRNNYIQRLKRENANWDRWKRAYGHNYKTEAEAVAAYKQEQREIYERDSGPTLLSGGHGDSFNRPWVPSSPPKLARSYSSFKRSLLSRLPSSSRSSSSLSSSSSRRFSFDKNYSRSDSKEKRKKERRRKSVPVGDLEHPAPSLDRVLSDIPVTRGGRE